MDGEGKERDEPRTQGKGFVWVERGGKGGATRPAGRLVSVRKWESRGWAEREGGYQSEWRSNAFGGKEKG